MHLKIFISFISLFAPALVSGQSFYLDGHPFISVPDGNITITNGLVQFNGGNFCPTGCPPETGAYFKFQRNRTALALVSTAFE
jgi:hypothetical protein